MGEVGESEFESLAWADHTDEDYNNACAAAEVCVTLADKNDLSKIKAALVFDKNKKGSNGISLQSDTVICDICPIEIIYSHAHGNSYESKGNSLSKDSQRRVPVFSNIYI